MYCTTLNDFFKVKFLQKNQRMSLLSFHVALEIYGDGRIFYFMSAEKKQSNRAIQRKHKTYSHTPDISEGLHLIKPYVSETTYKYLCHFTHTQGQGVTQAKVTTICKLA